MIYNTFPLIVIVAVFAIFILAGVANGHGRYMARSIAKYTTRRDSMWIMDVAVLGSLAAIAVVAACFFR